MPRKILILIFFAMIIAGCSPVYRQVLKEAPDYNSREFSASKEALFQATISALCKRNFIIENEDKEKGFILGKRSFQSGRRTTVLIIQAKLIPAESKTRLYLNGVETKEVSYVADRTRFFLFIVPLPGGGGKEGSSVKEGEKTIQDRVFYQGLFKAIEKEIPLATEELPKKTTEEIPATQDAPRKIDPTAGASL